MAGHGSVTRRKVFFIPGFDPLGARRYRELYRKQGAAQAAVSGYDLHMEAVPGGGRYRWRATMDGASTAEIEFLEWADLVRDAMAVPIPVSYQQLARTLWLYLRSGALRALIRLRYVPMLIALYPAVALMAYLVICGLAAWAVVAVAGALGLPGPLALAIGAAAFAGLMILLRRRDNRLYAYYLMADYAFAAREGGRMPDPLVHRVAEFTARVDEALGEDWDEVLIVGHSSGAQLGVHVAARAQRPANGPAFSLLTLGQVIPMVSFLPTADDLRTDLARAAARTDLYWLDVSAPSDGACFALADPVDVTGVAPDAKVNPTVISAKFSRTLSDRQQKELHRRYFTKHVQYLRAFERVEDYDYFAITAGPMSLRERFGHRTSSASAIHDRYAP
ncbi:MAG: hypothetical protein ACPGID_02640 [Rubricella sp.]